MAAPRRSRTYLEGATYEMRDYVKRHGGRFDKERKGWYVLGDVPESLCDLVEPEPGKARRFPRPLDLALNEPPTPAKAPTKAAYKRSLRQPPMMDVQADFFVPALYDVAGKENRSTMDVAVFRLSKKDNRAGAVLRYELADGYIEVKAGPEGMASVWDYDIVLMAISHLTEAVNRWRAGMGDKPSHTFRPHVSEILKFCRKSDGGRQVAEIEAALDRLRSTTIKISRRGMKNGRPVRELQAEGLINNYRVVSYTDADKIAEVEILIPQWVYEPVVNEKRPDVLTVHRDYFLIEQGIGRYVYRIARQAAGKGQARWYFKTIYERSGSAGSFREFRRILRGIIEANDLPEYALAEGEGQDGPVLVMTYRDAAAEGEQGACVIDGASPVQPV